MGTLFVVATPIGNLQDITIRAVKTLFTVDVIACEDTRRTGLLLHELATPFGLLVSNADSLPPKPQLLSYYEQIELRRIPEIISLLLDDKNVALVSDAGMPAVSDPGFKLIRECVRAGISVDVLPGPSSVLTALAISGLPTDKFAFLGYPPRKPGHRIAFYENVKASLQLIKATQIIFEAPHKLLTTLKEMQGVFGEIDVVICRELTKTHQEIRRENIATAIEYFSKHTPKGECIIVF